MSALKSIRRILSRKNEPIETDIHQRMQLERNKANRTIRILFLGSSSCGKTTIIKQIRQIHQTITEDDIKIMTPYIQDAVVGYAKFLCFQSIQLQERYSDNDNIWNVLKKWRMKERKISEYIVCRFVKQCQQLLPTNNIFYTIPPCIYNICMNYYGHYQNIECNTKIQEENESLRQEILSLKSPYDINPKLGDKIAKIWTDPGIQNTFILRSNYQLHENVGYFLDHIKRICVDNYEPSFDDYLRIRTRSTGFAMHKVTTNIDKFGEYIFEFTDTGGERSERKKWMKIVTESIDGIIYPVGISDYDKACFEDNISNRLHESINLFKELVNGHWFNGKSVIIFFNKYDLFRQKIKIIPITVAFDDYPETEDYDPNDEDQVVKFIATKFLNCFDGKNVKLSTPLHIHRTNALNTENIEKVFKDIALDLVKLRLKVLFKSD